MKFFSSPSHYVLLERTFLLLCILGITQFHVNAQWSQTNGPVGITINAFHDSQNGLYAGSSAKGVFKSMDHGINWTAANAGIENTEIFSFTEDEDYLYAGSLQGAYRSTDAGETWTSASSGIEDKAVYEMTTGDGYVFAGTIGTGVYRSADQGATWEDANGGALGSSFILAMCYVGNRLIVEGDNYIYYSFDNGDSWNLDNGAQFYPIENFFVTNDTIYASAYGGVFYSYDGGANWSDFISISSTFGDNILGFAQTNDTLYVGFASGMYYSTDHAQSWTQIPQTGLRFGYRFSHAFIGSGSNYLIGIDELGIYSSSNTGVTWIHGIKGITPASTIDNSMMAIGDEVWTGTHSNGVFQTDDNGLNWNKVGTTNDLDTLSNAIVFALFSPATNVILAGTCSYGLYRSDDNGSTWSHITDGLPWSANGGYECDEHFALVGDHLLVGTTDGLFYSTDLGLTWHPSTLGTTGTVVEGIAVNGDIAVAGVTNPSGIYRSTDFGESWTLASQVFDVLCVESDGNQNFYAGTFEDNWRSTDNGLSWNEMTNGIPSGHGGYTIHVIDSNVFVGDDAGVFWSSDQGESFTDASDGLDPYPNNAVQGLTSNSQYLFAGLFRDAVWKRPLSDFGIGDVATGVNNPGSKSDIYFSNSPNPFHDVTTLTYFIPKTEDISIQITDITGKIIFERNVMSVRTGTHSFDFNGRELASGIYFAKLKANNEVKVLKMILSK